MIRAGIAPFVTGWAGVAIVNDAVPMRAVFVASFEVGALMPAPGGGADGRDKIRAVDLEHVSAVADLILDAVIAYGAERVAITDDAGAHGVNAERARMVADEVRARLADIGKACAMVPRARGWAVRHDVPALAGWPATQADGDRMVTRYAAGAVLADMSAAPLVANARPVPFCGTLTDAQEARADMSAAPPAPPVKPSKPAAPDAETMAVDPGSTRIGLAIGPVDAHAMTIPAALVEPLARPVRKTRRDGSEYLVTTKRSLPWDRVVSIARRILDVALAHGIKRIVIERVTNAHAPADPGGAAAASIAIGLVRSGEIGAAVGMLAEVHGLEVVRVGASTWRAAITGKARVKGDARTAAIGAAIARAFPGVDLAGTDADARDALGMLLWSTLPPPEPAEVPAPRAGRRATEVRRERGSDAERKRKARATARADSEAARAAAGCKCRVGGRHKATCPLFVPKVAAPVATPAPAPCDHVLPASDRNPAPCDH